MSRSFDLPGVEWATVGTVGEPGHRTFYLQARQGTEQVTIKLEKQQVAALSQFLVEILSDLPAPESTPAEESLDLAEPLAAEWAAGTIQLAYDSPTDRIVLTAEEARFQEEEGGEPGSEAGAQAREQRRRDPEAVAEEAAVARLALTRAQAAAIARRGWEAVRGGRPLCHLCGNPIDPEGHACPRTNGHRPGAG